MRSIVRKMASCTIKAWRLYSAVRLENKVTLLYQKASRQLLHTHGDINVSWAQFILLKFWDIMH